MKHSALAALLCALPAAAFAVTPSSGTLDIYTTEIEYTGSMLVGVNPTPILSGDPTNVAIHCEPGVTCETFDLTLDLPDNLTEVFPTAILKLEITWSSPTGLPTDDYDFYAYDDQGNEIGNSGGTTPLDGEIESITLPVSNGLTEIDLVIAKFAVAGSDLKGSIVLDLGFPSDEADLDAFYAANPPSDGFFIAADQSHESIVSGQRSLRSSGGALAWLSLAAFALLGVRRRA